MNADPLHPRTAVRVAVRVRVAVNIISVDTTVAMIVYTVVAQLHRRSGMSAAALWDR